MPQTSQWFHTYRRTSLACLVETWGGGEFIFCTPTLLKAPEIWRNPESFLLHLPLICETEMQERSQSHLIFNFPEG